MKEVSVDLGSVTVPMDCILLLIMSYNAFLIANIGLLYVHFKCDSKRMNCLKFLGEK